MVTNYIHTQLIMYNYKSLKSKLVCDFFFLLYSGILTNQFLFADTHIYSTAESSQQHFLASNFGDNLFL